MCFINNKLRRPVTITGYLCIGRAFRTHVSRRHVWHRFWKDRPAALRKGRTAREEARASSACQPPPGDVTSHYLRVLEPFNLPTLRRLPPGKQTRKCVHSSGSNARNGSFPWPGRLVPAYPGDGELTAFTCREWSITAANTERAWPVLGHPRCRHPGQLIIACRKRERSGRNDPDSDTYPAVLPANRSVTCKPSSSSTIERGF